MAKIRVAQIKDLSLTVPTTDNGFATLEVGTTTKEVLTSIAEGTPAEGTTQSGIMTGISVNGNTITPEYKTFEQLNLYTKTEVDGKITSAIEALDTTADVTIASESAGVVTLKAGIAQENGLIKQGTGADITLAKVATTGEAADVMFADTQNLFDETVTDVEKALAEVMTKANTLEAAQLKAGTGIEIDTENKINAKFDIAIETRTEGETTATYIVIKDGETVIAEENANAFVKDGFLQKVEKNANDNTLIFTWNTDAGIEQTTIAISDLCDVYTADETYLHLNGYNFEHKTITGLDSTNTHGIDESISVTDTTTKTFNVPSLKVDAAGHVTSVDEKTVTITLPASIDTAVQTVTGEEDIDGGNSDFVAVSAEQSEDNKTVTISSKVKVQAMATADSSNQGLAEASDVKAYVARNAATTMYREVISVANNTATLTYVPTGDVAITQNGLDLGLKEDGVTKEYSHNGKNVTFNLEVAAVDGDVFVAYYMYNPTTQPTQA